MSYKGSSDPKAKTGADVTKHRWVLSEMIRESIQPGLPTPDEASARQRCLRERRGRTGSGLHLLKHGRRSSHALELLTEGRLVKIFGIQVTRILLLELDRRTPGNRWSFILFKGEKNNRKPKLAKAKKEKLHVSRPPFSIFASPPISCDRIRETKTFGLAHHRYELFLFRASATITELS